MAGLNVSLVLIGPHGAGKTTLGKMVSACTGWQYDQEIGRVLRLHALQKSSKNHALTSQEAFDKKVTIRELQRDNKFKGFRVVETWHPGNLAYAQMRSPEIAESLEGMIKRHLDSFGQSVLVQTLRISTGTAFKRLTEPGGEPRERVNFFLNVAKRAEELAEVWGLEKLPVLYTDTTSPSDLCKTIVNNLSEYGLHSWAVAN